VLSPQLAAGILIACGTMFPRILIYCGIINPALLPSLVVPVVAMALMLYVPAGVIWHRNRESLRVDQPMLNRNPWTSSRRCFRGPADVDPAGRPLAE